MIIIVLSFVLDLHCPLEIFRPGGYEVPSSTADGKYVGTILNNIQYTYFFHACPLNLPLISFLKKYICLAI